VKFGEFTLKSGKKSNIFFDFGQLMYGSELTALGRYFADFIAKNSLDTSDVLFGPPYKGINIAIATSIALYEKYGQSIPYAYNRKAEKDHAEGGKIVGFDLSAARSALILDDVFTDGGTKYETLEILSRFQNLTIRAIVVGVDREEVDQDGKAYRSVFEGKTGVKVLAITSKSEVLASRDSA